jgi:hypothetical protein
VCERERERERALDFKPSPWCLWEGRRQSGLLLAVVAGDLVLRAAGGGSVWVPAAPSCAVPELACWEGRKRRRREGKRGRGGQET